MTRIRTFLLMAFIVSSLAGCSGRTVFTVEVFKSPTPTSVPAATSTTTPPVAVATSTPPVMPRDFSPVLYGRNYGENTFLVLLGGLQDDVWLSPDLTAIQYQHIPDSVYDVYTLAQEKYEFDGSAPVFSPSGKMYTVATNSRLGEFGMVAVAHGWPILQRDVQRLFPDGELYRQVVLDWLKGEGLRSPESGILSIYRVDIEGDGVDEIFISATHLDGTQHTTRAGDYSIVLMRKVAGNAAVTLPIVGDIYRSAEAEITFPRAYSLANFIDLNRDGILEVVVDVERWEADGTIVYQIDGQDVIETWRVE